MPFSLSLFASSPPISDTLSETIISGTLLSSPTKSSAPIQVLSKHNIQNLGIQTLSEAIKTFSGVNIKDYGGIGGLKTVSVRSLGSTHTAVIYDGVAMSNSQSGQIDISRFNLDNISSVQLSIGQEDNIFQSARTLASAAVLSLVSSKPFYEDKNYHINAQMSLGSFNTYNPSLYYDQKLSEKWWLSVSTDYLNTKGNYPFILENGTHSSTEIRENSDLESFNGEINLSGELGNYGKLQFKSSYYDSERGLPGGIILYADNNAERLWDKVAFTQANYQVKFSDKWEMLAQAKYNYAWTHYQNPESIYTDGVQNDIYTQEEYYLSSAVKYAPFEHLSVSLAQDYFINTLDANLPDFLFPSRYTSLTALSGQYQNSRVRFTLSALATYISESTKTGEAAPNRFRISPSASFSFKVLEDEDLRVRASYRDGFRVPTFNELYYARIGNSDLRPEIATQFNLGLTWRKDINNNILQTFSLSLDSYYNKVEDKIVALPSMFLWRMLNVGEASILGSDINASAYLTLSHWLSLELSANYSYQYAVDVTDPESKNYKHQIPYTPRHSGNLAAILLNKWINVSYTINAVGERYSFPQNIAPNLIEGYLDHNLSLFRTFKWDDYSLKIQAECLNITNTHYEVIKYYPMPGRSFRITLQIIY